MDTGNDVQKEARTPKRAEEGEVQETPQDVAVLYSWANVHGAKYRDFSASRREYRAQMRRRMAEQQARDAEQHAADEAKSATEAQAAAAMATQGSRVAAEALAARHVEEARKAAQAASEAEAAAEAAAREEEAARAELLAQMQEAAQVKPPVQTAAVAMVAGALEDPYRVPGHGVAQRAMMPPAAPATPSLAERIAATAAASTQNSPVRPAAPQPPVKQSWTESPQAQQSPMQISTQPQIPAQNFYAPAPVTPAYEPHLYEPQYSQPEQMRVAPPVKQAEYNIPPVRPAWLHESEQLVARSQQQPSPLADTLQHSRERVAARWFALKGAFESAAADPESQQVRQALPRTPVLTVFSLAGGVGKTSIVATLGRALSSLGERALLTDTTTYGLLPFYFGARDLRPGVVRTFTPPSGSTDAPINLVNLDTEKTVSEVGSSTQDMLTEEIARSSRGANRVLVDLATASGTLMRRILRMGPIVLVPVSPDMNSVISITAVEQFFQNQVDADGRPIKVFYMLNQFDASQPLHLDVREVLRQQLGDRLLPFVIRRSAAISEALAEGMTVMDYAPNSPVAEDYMNLAAWVRNVSAPASLGFRGVRWSEQR